MFKFLKPKRSTSDHSPGAATVSSTPDSTQQHSSIRRELVRVVLKDIMRIYGIPFGWLACEVTVVTRAPGEEELHIQLVIMKWKERLLPYAPALEQQLRTGLDRFDPAADHSKYMVSWRFSPDCGYPATSMPDPQFWQQDVLPRAAEPSVSVLDRRNARRLPKSPRVHLSPPNINDRRSDFSATRIAPLR